MCFLEKRELASHYLYKDRKKELGIQSQIFNIRNNNSREYSKPAERKRENI